MARIVIAGCGYVGSELALNLIQAGHEVWGLKRNTATLATPIQALAADLSDRNSLLFPPKLDYVVYAAAAGGFSEQRYQTAYVDGIANILAALKDAGQSLKRFIFVSSTSVYGQHQAEWIDESSPANADGFAANCLRTGEQQVWDSPYSGIVIRFGGIYGPGRTRLLDSVRSGSARCVEGVYSNRIHRDDCAAALQHLLTLTDVELEPLYIGVDDEPVLQCEVLQWLATQLQAPPPLIVTADESPETRMRTNKRCRNNRLRNGGFRCRYPSFREGYAELIAG